MRVVLGASTDIGEVSTPQGRRRHSGITRCPVLCELTFGGRVRESRMWGQGSARKATRRHQTYRHVELKLKRVRAKLDVGMKYWTAAQIHRTVENRKVLWRSYWTQPRQPWREFLASRKPWRYQLPPIFSLLDLLCGYHNV